MLFDIDLYVARAPQLWYLFTHSTLIEDPSAGEKKLGIFSPATCWKKPY